MFNSYNKKDYINLIKFYKNNKINNFNLIISYSKYYKIDNLILDFIMWILCSKKKKYKICNKCKSCKLFKNKIYINFYYIKDNININSLRVIYNNWYKNINFIGIKIIYFSKFNFINFYVNNFLIKWLEFSYNKSIFIFSSIYNTYIPFTIISRCYKIKLLILNENYLYNILVKKYKLINFSKENILSAIRLSNNSLFYSLKILKKLWNTRNNLIKYILNMKKYNINFLVKNINNIYLNHNLYFLVTFFLDYIKFRLNNIKYLFNLDILFLFKYFNKYISINNAFLIFKKIIFCMNNLKNIKNINKNILIYELISFIYLKI